MGTKIVRWNGALAWARAVVFAAVALPAIHQADRAPHPLHHGPLRKCLLSGLPGRFPSGLRLFEAVFLNHSHRSSRIEIRSPIVVDGRVVGS